MNSCLKAGEQTHFFSYKDRFKEITKKILIVLRRQNPQHIIFIKIRLICMTSFFVIHCKTMITVDANHVSDYRTKKSAVE